MIGCWWPENGGTNRAKRTLTAQWQIQHKLKSISLQLHTMGRQDDSRPLGPTALHTTLWTHGDMTVIRSPLSEKGQLLYTLPFGHMVTWLSSDLLSLRRANFSTHYPLDIWWHDCHQISSPWEGPTSLHTTLWTHGDMTVIRSPLLEKGQLLYTLPFGHMVTWLSSDLLSLSRPTAITYYKRITTAKLKIHRPTALTNVTIVQWIASVSTFILSNVDIRQSNSKHRLLLTTRICIQIHFKVYNI